MTQAQPQLTTFADYLAYSEDLEGRFQFIDGALIELPPESEPNNWIANSLFLLLANTGSIRKNSVSLGTPCL